jgi:hypothetical protein
MLISGLFLFSLLKCSGYRTGILRYNNDVVKKYRREISESSGIRKLRTQAGEQV